MRDISDTLSSFIKDSGISHKETSTSYIFDCPRCNKREKLYIRKNDGRFICFVCRDNSNFYGRAENALTELTNTDIQQIKALLYKDYEQLSIENHLDIHLKDFFDDIDELPEEVQLTEVVYPINFYPIDHKLSEAGISYLNGRGISLGIAKIYDIQYDILNSRVIFPLKINNKLIGWQGRTTKDDLVRYAKENGRVYQKSLNSKGMPRAQSIMFYDRIAPGSHIIICEGPIDAIKADSCDGGNIATLGKTISDGQICLLKSKYPKRIYLGLDPDAYKESEKLVEKFSEIDVYNLEIPKPYKDLGEMDFKDVKELFLSAKKINNGHIFFNLI